MDMPFIEKWKWWHNLTSLGLIGLIVVFPVLEEYFIISASTACFCFSIVGSESTHKVREHDSWKRSTKWKHTAIGWIFLVLGLVFTVTSVFLALPMEVWANSPN